MRSRSLPAASVLTLSLLAGCTGGSDSAAPAVTQAPTPPATGPVRVAANFYPVEFLAQRIGGDLVEVTGLTPAGTEPHDLALTGPALAGLQGADLVLYLGLDYQPDVTRAVAGLPADTVAIDLLEAPGLNLIDSPADLGKEPLSGNKDPHVWLDPVRLRAMALPVFTALVKARPDQADRLQQNLAGLTNDLDALDAQLRAALAPCRQRTIVTSHAAFGYLAARYDLTQLAIAGLSPDDEPDAATLAEITDGAREAGVSTVYFEEVLPADLARTVAGAIGAKVDLLGALEFAPSEQFGSGADYLSVMRGNSERLRGGLDCG